MKALNLRVSYSISSDKKYISFLQENSVPTKENDCGDVTHYDDDALMHEIADILANKLPYSVANENGLMENSICLEANGEKAKFEKRSRSKRR